MTEFEEWACKEAYHIQILSDTPSHLWLRWSHNRPQKHPRARIFRGLNIEGDVYYCFTAYHDIEQDEAGDTLTHTFTMSPWLLSTRPLLMYFPPDGSDAPYFEPWGTLLQDNHPWTQAIVADPVSYALSAGILHLFNPAPPVSGLRTIIPHGTYPLVDPEFDELHFRARAVSATITNPTDYIAYHFHLTKELEDVIIEFIIARGDAWGEWPQPDKIIDNQFFRDYGLKPEKVNIVNLFKRVRASEGKSTSAVGWDCFLAYITLEHDTTPTSMGVFNDYLHLYYPSSTPVAYQTGPRFFFFHGQINGVVSRSASPIFGRRIYYKSKYRASSITHEDDAAVITHNEVVSFPPSTPAFNTVGRLAPATDKLGGAFRFRNVALPRCAEVLDSLMVVTSAFIYSNTPVHSRVSAELSGNADDFNSITTAQFWTRYATRTGITDWNDMLIWSFGVQYESPSLVSPVQAIVSHPSWQSGNALVLFFEDFDQRTPLPLGKVRVCRVYAPPLIGSPVLHVWFNHWQVKEVQLF